MIELLGIDQHPPPKGWLKCFFDALIGLDKPVFLLLDDYMTVGINHLESDLLFAIKSRIRCSQVTVIVLTQNKDSADHMLTRNEWVGVVPLMH
jgi:ATP/maltotriose-dependent transcriptional regulator MalT